MQNKLNHDKSLANLAAMRVDLYGTVSSAIDSGCLATVFDCYAWLEGGNFDEASVYPDADICWNMVETVVEQQI